MKTMRTTYLFARYVSSARLQELHVSTAILLNVLAEIDYDSQLLVILCRV